MRVDEESSLDCSGFSAGMSDIVCAWQRNLKDCQGQLQVWREQHDVMSAEVQTCKNQDHEQTDLKKQNKDLQFKLQQEKEKVVQKTAETKTLTETETELKKEVKELQEEIQAEKDKLSKKFFCL